MSSAPFVPEQHLQVCFVTIKFPRIRVPLGGERSHLSSPRPLHLECSLKELSFSDY